ncbi:MAG: NAD+ synthase [Phycisphaeraceae bacterium]|nr:MAG: NAD+ synthase [Phycisphaeraceae bacterium]
MRLALAQINPTVGDLPANARLIADALRHAASLHADLLVVPELAICGYPPRDLLLRRGFIDACLHAAHDLAPLTTAGPALVLGTPAFSPSGHATNSLLCFQHGHPAARYDKRLLPTYDVFDEDRYFEPGHAPAVVHIRTPHGPVPVGLSICEDLWKGEDAGFAARYANRPDPVPELIAAGARLIVNPSASPFVLGKGQRHRAILAAHASRHRVHVASVNQVGGNDDLIFDGHAAVFSPQGRLAAAAPGFTPHLLIHDLDPAAAAPTPAVEDPLLAAHLDQLAFLALVLGIRDYARKTGFTSALLGISGGIDSALTAALAATALGPDNVLGVALPGPYSSSHALEDALDTAARLGIRHLTIPISPPVEAFRHQLDPAFTRLNTTTLGQSLPDLAEENLQSRVRGTVLMALSNRTGALLLSTGNKSELAVGYCTLYGDMNGGLAVLSDLRKSAVYSLARWLNANPAAAGFSTPPIPPRSIDKAPSAELRPNQTDQDSLPPYDLLDAVVEMVIEQSLDPATIAQRLEIDHALVVRLARMIDAAEYKRRQAPLGLKLTSVAFGPGRRVPIAHRFTPR